MVESGGLLTGSFGTAYTAPTCFPELGVADAAVATGDIANDASLSLR
jgi:hypothetical protein